MECRNTFETMRGLTASCATLNKATSVNQSLHKPPYTLSPPSHPYTTLPLLQAARGNSQEMLYFKHYLRRFSFLSYVQLLYG